MRRLFMAAALAAAPIAFAFSPALALTDTNNPGIDDLGVDISSVPFTRAGVQDFLSTLAPETRHSVEAACDNYVRNGESIGLDVQTITFCQQAVRA
jgi:hypothetical protein